MRQPPRVPDTEAMLVPIPLGLLSGTYRGWDMSWCARQLPCPCLCGLCEVSLGILGDPGHTPGVVWALGLRWRRSSLRPSFIQQMCIGTHCVPGLAMNKQSHPYLSTSLLGGAIQYPKFSLNFYFKKPWFVLLENFFRNQSLGIQCSHWH